MRIAIAALLAALAVGCSQKHDDHNSDAKGEKSHDAAGGHKHGGDEHAGHMAALTALDLKTRDGLKAGTAVTLRFTVSDAGGKPVTAFAVAHDAKVHFILIRQGLDTFAHLHPEVDPATGVLSAEYTFPTGGVYHLFADYQEPGGMPTTATARVEVGGDAPPAAGLKPDVPGLLAGEKVAARVSVEGTKAGSEAKVRFEVLDGDKPATDLEPYMGAMGHLVVVSADGKRYVHAHPDERSEAKNVVTFGAAFPSPGVFKGWGQFKRAGQVRVVPFVVRID